MGTLAVEFVGSNGDRRFMHVVDAPSLAAGVTFAESLLAYTNAKIRRVSYTEAQYLSNSSKPDAEQTVDRYGLIIFRKSDDRITKLALPAPILAQYGDSGPYRLDKEHGDALATLLGTLIGDTLTFQHGAICGKAGNG